MTLSIVAADDSVGVHRALEEALGDDAALESFLNGSDAWSRIESGPRPDLVVADVHMPGTGGLELAAKIKEMDSAIPVLILVGTFEPFDSDAFAGSGADEVLKKPVAVPELREGVLRLLGGLPDPDSAEEAPKEEAHSAEISVELSEEEAGDEPGADLEDVASPAPTDEPKVEAPDDAPGELAAEPEATAESTLSFGGTDFSEVETAIYDTPPIPAPAAPPKPEPVDDGSPTGSSGALELSDDDVDRIARRMVELAGDGVLREIAWEVVPDLAEVLIRERLEKLERELEESS